MSAEKLDIGVVCNSLDNLSMLSERLSVSDGLRVIPQKEAVKLGFIDIPGGILVPQAYRPAEANELEQLAITQTENTRWPLQLVKVPASLGQAGLAFLEPYNGMLYPDPMPRRELIPGLFGEYVNAGYDQPDADTTCVVRKTTDQAAPVAKKVGLHLDIYPDSPITDAIFAVVPVEGWRRHVLVPGVTLDVLDNPPPREVKTVMREYVLDSGPENFKALAFTLGPSEALIGSPVQNMLHDGNTVGFTSGSLAVLASVRIPRPGTFESIV